MNDKTIEELVDELPPPGPSETEARRQVARDHIAAALADHRLPTADARWCEICDEMWPCTTAELCGDIEWLLAQPREAQP